MLKVCTQNVDVVIFQFYFNDIMHVYRISYSAACTKYDPEVELKDYKQGKAKFFIFLTYEILTPTPTKIAIFTLLGLKKMLCFRFPDRLVKICADCNFFSAQKKKKKKKSATDPVQRFRFLSKVKTISLREFVRADFRIFSVFNNYDQEQQHGYCVVC